MSIDLPERTHEMQAVDNYKEVTSVELELQKEVADDLLATDIDQTNDEYAPRLLSIHVIKKTGGIAMADGSRKWFYDREMSEEEATSRGFRKEVNAQPGVQPQGRLGELNPHIN